MADPRRRFQVVTELSILDNLDAPGYPMELATWLAEHFVEDAEMRGAPTEARTISVVEVPVPLATGDQLDAERRGDVYDPCRGCIHEAHELTCLAVLDAGRAQRCGCHTRKSENLKES